MSLEVKIGKNIEDQRKKRDKTQEELAHDAGMSTTYLGRIERGKVNPTLKALKRIANALNVPITTIFFGGRTKRLRMRHP